MKVVYEADDFTVDKGTVIALGDFDGLHIAHMKIIRSCIRYAGDNGLYSGVFLFEENTKGNTELITPNEAKLELLEREKPDFVYIRKFTKNFMHLLPEEFIKLLVEKLNVKAIFVGYDYSFGYKAEGNVRLLKELGEKYDFKVFVTDAVRIDGEIVSSTYIRNLVKKGDMENAERFLGRRFCVEGCVVKGKQNGRKMGIPTANVEYSDNMALPCEGVYAGITYVDGRRLKSVINVGKNPTFNAQKLTIESHILNFDEDIYGKYIRVSFAEYIRGVVKFSGMDELKGKINEDIKKVRKMVL